MLKHCNMNKKSSNYEILSEVTSITIDGFVYSWGFNKFCNLGHNLDRNENIFETRLIENLSNISLICFFICCPVGITYFLTNDGLLYYCGQMSNNSFQKSPKLLIIDFKLGFIDKIISIKKRTLITAAISADAVNTVFSLRDNQLIKEKYKNIFDFVLNEFQMTAQTVETPQTAETPQTVETNHFDRNFIEICKLDKGGFGSVVKVEDKFSKVLTAVKKITLKGRNYFICY